jgi:hypothetical protein
VFPLRTSCRRSLLFDSESKIAAKLQGGYTRSMEEFRKVCCCALIAFLCSSSLLLWQHIDEKWTPPGEKVHEYAVASSNMTYEIYRV